MIIDVLVYIVALVFAINVLYVLFFAIAGLWPVKKVENKVAKFNRFAIFIPAYKGDEVILSTMFSSFKQDYPRDKYEIIIIADSLQSYTVGEMKLHPIKVVEVQFDNSTKAKSLNAAIDTLNAADYDYAVVLDIDNVMEEDFLTKINARLQNNELIIQAHRIAKNTDTPFAILDAVSEEINNHLFRKAHDNVGLSAALIGSAMAMRYDWFVDLMKKITAIGGFDKELEVNIISYNIRIDYAHDIYVYDEKVQRSDVFKNQRKRWLSAQLNYLVKYGPQSFVKGIKTKNFDLIDKIIQFALLPRLILLGMLVILASTYFMGFKHGIVFLTLAQIYLFGLIISIPNEYFKFKYFVAMLYLPKAFMVMFLTMFKLKGANKKFIHTPHAVTKSDK